MHIQWKRGWGGVLPVCVVVVDNRPPRQVLCDCYYPTTRMSKKKMFFFFSVDKPSRVAIKEFKKRDRKKGERRDGLV